MALLKRRTKRNAEIGLARHTKGGGVDDGGGPFEHVARVNPVVHGDLGTKIGAKGICTGAAAVGEPDLIRRHGMHQLPEDGALVEEGADIAKDGLRLLLEINQPLILH